MSPQGLELLIEREGGRRNAVYRDSEGILTVGVGHTGPDVIEGEIWTDERCDKAFRKDLAWVEAAIAESVKADLLPNQHDSLGSFTFNVGADGEEHSTMAREINAGASPDQVALQFDRWHIPAEITTRRNGEKFQWLGTTFAARCDNEGNPVA